MSRKFDETQVDGNILDVVADLKKRIRDMELRGGVSVSAAVSGSTSSSTNHLMNGGFNIAQRQTPGTLTTIADLGYSADRWKISRENADLQYIRVDGSGESGLTSPFYGQYKKITNAGKFLVCQPLEYLDTLKFRGETISFQLQMKASASKTIKIAIVELQTGGTADTLPTLVSAWGADGTDPTFGANLAVIGTPTSCGVTTGWQVFQFTGTFPATSKNLLVMVWSDADFAINDTLSLAEAGLYTGSGLAAWNPITAHDDLQMCMRYYEKSFLPDVAPVQNVGIRSGEFQFAAGKAGVATNWSSPYCFKSIKRISPSITFYNPAAANALIRDFVAVANFSSTTFNQKNVSHFNVTGTGAAGTAVGNVCGVHWTAEAEL